MTSTKGDNTPTNTPSSIDEVINTYIQGLHNPRDDSLYNELRAKRDTEALKDAVNKLISEAVNKALDKLHYDIMDGKFRPPEGTTDPAFYYAQFHRIIDVNKLKTPNQVEKGTK
jgi:hypothetical protein